MPKMLTKLNELYKQKKVLKREIAMEEEKLDARMEFVRHEHEVELLKEKLRIREADRERQKKEWDMKQRQAEKQKIREMELKCQWAKATSLAILQYGQ
ncbi:hrp65 protein-like [Polyergus mexicanus]|uniref:hrp65 protein-like n=1 Tax=Polyergus mexicanus TaxID=615972 RepID=UPI0038B68353